MLISTKALLVRSCLMVFVRSEGGKFSKTKSEAPCPIPTRSGCHTARLMRSTPSPYSGVRPCAWLRAASRCPYRTRFDHALCAAFGKGFDVVLEALPVNGRVSIREPKEKDAKDGAGE
jgi:hypothetical protein